MTHAHAAQSRPPYTYVARESLKVYPLVDSRAWSTGRIGTGTRAHYASDLNVRLSLRVYDKVHTQGYGARGGQWGHSSSIPSPLGIYEQFSSGGCIRCA